jgi:hypothetical protein
MISCAEFIPAYSELFRYLHQRGGPTAVQGFWAYLSDRYLTDLRDLVTTHGLKGCWLYWSRTLNEEAADFVMELDEDAGFFRITMRRCPSKQRLSTADTATCSTDGCWSRWAIRTNSTMQKRTRRAASSPSAVSPRVDPTEAPPEAAAPRPAAPWARHPARRWPD